MCRYVVTDKTKSFVFLIVSDGCSAIVQYKPLADLVFTLLRIVRYLGQWT